MMKITIERVPEENAFIIRNLMHLYLYDFSEFDDVELNEDGLYVDEHLDKYWSEPGRHPFIIKSNGKLAGFALICDYTNAHAPGRNYVSEFFISRRYRRAGIGTIAARRLFDMFPGTWQVLELEGNVAAQVFWRKVIYEYTGGQFEDNAWKKGQAQVFDSPAPKS